MDGEAAPLARPFWDSDGPPAWLTSLVIHTLALIILAWLELAPGGETAMITLRPATGPTTETRFQTPPPLVDQIDDRASAAAAAESLATDSAVADLNQPWLPTPPIAIDATALLRSVEDRSADNDDTLQDHLARALAGDTNGQSSELSVTRPLRPTGGIAPRTPESRAELGARYGATPDSERAVELGLAWLAEHQRPNGSWNFDLTLDPCRGRCSHSSLPGNNSTPSTAATGLALLAFLGAGYSYHEGKYAETVQRGIYYLREQALPTQSGRDLQAGSMYGHGIATLALAEALAMDNYFGHEDPELRALVEDLVLFTCVAQHPRGGWRYVPGSPGDMTVSAWQVLSLVSARYSNIPLGTSTLPRALDFFQSLSVPGSYEFGYVSPRPRPSTTAIGLCMLLYLGHSPGHTPLLVALGQVIQRGPTKTDLYHDYYATLALHHSRHPAWEDWHVPLRDHLVRTQAKQGHERGSWHFRDHHGDVGGRLYSTAMAIMILEIYYRHIPLYQDLDEFPIH